MASADLERVLGVPRESFDRIGSFQGFCGAADKYLGALLADPELSFRPRGEIEDDPSFKQLIPYLVLRHDNHLFRYRRAMKGNETRLHALTSIGIGGHVSSDDAPAGPEAFAQGMQRELAEEVEIGSPYTVRCVGLVNDDSNPVGQVHLGMVHVVELSDQNVRIREDALAGGQFLSLAQIWDERDTLETWSQLVLAGLWSGGKGKEMAPA